MSLISAGFSLGGYKDLIHGLRKRGYRIADYDDVATDKRDVILRHDIDISLESAVAMAEAEREIDALGVYFFLLRSEFYNPFSARGARALERILSLGHRIGLHLDAGLYNDEIVRLEQAAAHEIDVFEKMLGCEVSAVSFHRPAMALLERDGPIAGKPNTYAAKYFRDMGYCSDSRGAWRHGHPFDHAALKSGTALQLLTHPEWWTGEDNEDGALRLRRYLAERSDFLDKELATHCRVHVAGKGRKRG